MIRIIFALTVRQMLGRGRTLMMVLLALLPVALALVYRLGSEDTRPQDWAAVVLFEALIVTTLLPLAALAGLTFRFGTFARFAAGFAHALFLGSAGSFIARSVAAGAILAWGVRVLTAATLAAAA